MKAHECVDCLALPSLEELRVQVDILRERPIDATEIRPKTPRPAPHGGPRSKRCTTHFRAWKRANRMKARVKTSQKVYGLAPDDRADLMVLQDGLCPICGRGLDVDGRGRFRATAHDHDHELAEQHDHPVDKACPECLRGLTCGWCNRELLPRIDLEAARRLVAYYENPPMARLRAARLKEAS